MKQNRMQQRWEHVMEKKAMNTETKQSHLKEMLNKYIRYVAE